MTLAKSTTTKQAQKIEQVVIDGDLSNLSPSERVAYYKEVCESLGLNPWTKPFAYLKLHNKLTLYALRDCADQLRAKHGISTSITSREVVNDVYVVTAKGVTPDGRNDESIGAVPIANLKGEELANAYMKAETKAKRRVTLSIVGLGWLDETEVASIPGARVITVNPETGELPSAAEPPQNPSEPPEAASPPTEPEPPEPAIIANVVRAAKQFNADLEAAGNGRPLQPRMADGWGKAQWGDEWDLMTNCTEEQSLALAGAIARGEVLEWAQAQES